MKRTFTYMDIDGCAYKRTMRLLRFVEHKQLDQSAKYAQSEALATIDRLIAHYIDCPAAPNDLHPRSGVYIMRGHVDAADSARHECQLAGPQVVTNPRLGRITIADESDLYEWLEGRLG
jgi:hypothetical protein